MSLPPPPPLKRSATSSTVTMIVSSPFPVRIRFSPVPEVMTSSPLVPLTSRMFVIEVKPDAVPAPRSTTTASCHSYSWPVVGACHIDMDRLDVREGADVGDAGGHAAGLGAVRVWFDGEPLIMTVSKSSPPSIVSSRRPMDTGQVVAGSAVDLVALAPTEERVVAVAAVELVGAGLSIKYVVAATADQHIDAATSVEMSSSTDPAVRLLAALLPVRLTIRSAERPWWFETSGSRTVVRMGARYWAIVTVPSALTLNAEAARLSANATRRRSTSAFRSRSRCPADCCPPAARR